MTNIEKRLRALEKRLSPAPLLVEVENADGQLETVTAAECIARGLDFKRVSPRNKDANLRDLDSLLQSIPSEFNTVCPESHGNALF